MPESNVRRVRRLLRPLLLRALILALAVYGLYGAALYSLGYINPLITTVQLQRQIAAWSSGTPYQRATQPVPLSSISPHLIHAVIAAEDGRFYDHHGIDWLEIQKVVDDSLARGRLTRGASTITQQLIKNLFFTTHRTAFRKAGEFALVPLAEQALTKDRILELYLNNIEWGPGIYGAEAASRHHFGIPAAKLSRRQSAALAACIPAPRSRTPRRVGRYRDIILARMRNYGW